MKTIKRILKIIIVIIVFSSIFMIIRNGEKNNDNYKVLKWDNYYDEDNLEIFYTKSDKRLETLNSTYRINEFLSKKDDEISKILTVVDIVNSIVEYDDVKDLEYFNGYDILSKKLDGKKISGRDMAIITRDFLSSAGYVSRIGQFKNEKGRFKKDQEYYVVEYWSSQYNKWIMIDFIDRGYFNNSKSPCSAIEVLTIKSKELDYIGKKNKKDYLSNKKDLFETYSMLIDNTLDMKKSNSVITLVKSDKGVYLEHKNKYLSPTIFTKEKKIFERDPNYKSNIKDKGIYIILMKKEGENKSFIIGGFQDGSILDQYYVRKNSGEFTLVNKYDEIELNSEKNLIEISIDGKDVISKIEIQTNKK